MSSDSDSDAHPSPSHSQQKADSRQRVWFIAGADSAIGITVARAAIEQDDIVIAGALSAKAGYSCPSADFVSFVSGVREADEATRRRLRVVGLNSALIGDCQAAVAEAVRHSGRIDILLLCSSEALFGTVEELAQSPRAVSAVRKQFASNLFGPVNIIKAALPRLRAQKSGHILVLTTIAAHIGTPGLSVYCASQWAIEGYCDSLAFEIAPFNVKLSIIQSTLEVAILTNAIVAAPSMPDYARDNNPAPLSRSLFASLLDRIDQASDEVDDKTGKRGEQLVHANEMVCVEPRLPASMKDSMLAETLYAIMQLGGHENPPARHIVGHEGVASVKEKLKTVSEELEEFAAVGEAVDYQLDS